MKALIIGIILSLLVFMFLYAEIRFFTKKRLPCKTRVLSEDYINPSIIKREDGSEIIFLRKWLYLGDKSQIMVSGQKLPIKNDDLFMGYEDPRAILFNNKIYLFVSGVTNESVNDDHGIDMYIIEINSLNEPLTAVKILHPFNTTKCKNFMPFISNNKLFVVYSLSPEYIILECETGQNLGNTKQVVKQVIDPVKFPEFKYYLKGGSKGCLYKGYLYFNIHKSTWSNQYYFNYLMKTQADYPFEILEISNPFILTEDEIIMTDLDYIMMLFHFGIRHVNFVSDMHISPQGEVEFAYGYGNVSSHTLTCKLEDIFKN